MAESRDASHHTHADAVIPEARAARAWERAVVAESRGARDPDGGLAFHWVAHSWRRCASACEHGTQIEASPVVSSHDGAGVAEVWEYVADAWEAAAVAWLAVAAAQRHLDASRAAEDRTERESSTEADAPELEADRVSKRAAAVAEARRVADERVRAAEHRERDARL